MTALTEFEAKVRESFGAVRSFVLEKEMHVPVRVIGLRRFPCQDWQHAEELFSRFLDILDEAPVGRGAAPAVYDAICGNRLFHTESLTPPLFNLQEAFARRVGRGGAVVNDRSIRTYALLTNVAPDLRLDIDVLAYMAIARGVMRFMELVTQRSLAEALHHCLATDEFTCWKAWMEYGEDGYFEQQARMFFVPVRLPAGWVLASRTDHKSSTPSGTMWFRTVFRDVQVEQLHCLGYGSVEDLSEVLSPIILGDPE